MAHRAEKSVLIFDGDDTLWRTMPLYTAAKKRFFRMMKGLGFDEERLSVEFERRDERNVSKWGFTIERFKCSMVETYEDLVRSRAGEPSLREEQRISKIATSVSRSKTRLIPYAKRTLEALEGRCRMVLLTKGEYSLQTARVEESGLRKFFERVVIVDHKEEKTFRRLAKELRADPRITWSIGDSVRSDVRTALAAGLNAIWIPQPTWSYEVSEQPPHPKLIQLRSIRALPAALRKAEAAP